MSHGGRAADPRRSLGRPVLERVVDERREPQPPALVLVARLAVDVGEHVGNVVLDGALGMAPARRSPLNPALPFGIGGDATLDLGLEIEGQC